MKWLWLTSPDALLIGFIAAATTIWQGLLPVVRKLVRWRTNKAVGDPTAVLTLGSHMGAVPTAGMPVVFMPTTPVAPGGDDPDFYWLPPLDLAS